MLRDYKTSTLTEADLRCSNAMQNIEKKITTACCASDANVDNVVKLLDGLLSDYETSCNGPGKWQKLAIFLKQSSEGPIRDLAKRLQDRIGSEKDSLVKMSFNWEKITQIETSEKHKFERVQHYKEAINEKKKLPDDYMKCISDMKSDEMHSNLVKALESAEQEALNWKSKHDHILAKPKADEDHTILDIAIFKPRSTAATQGELESVQKLRFSSLEARLLKQSWLLLKKSWNLPREKYWTGKESMAASRQNRERTKTVPVQKSRFSSPEARLQFRNRDSQVSKHGC